MEKSVGVDLGGTKIKIGFFENENLIKSISIDTNLAEKGKFIVSDICKVVNNIYKPNEIKYFGIAVPGPVLDGVVYGAHNLGWETIKLKEEFLKYYSNSKISILNDANAACFAEFFLLPENHKNVLLITLGTGIGAGIIVNRSLYIGSSGAAGEFGHIKVSDGNKRKCNCGLYDCVERYASATGIQLSAVENGLNENISCKEIFDLAKNGEIKAIKSIDLMIKKLSIALAATANILNPDCIIFGGGVSKSSDYFLNKLETEFKKNTFRTNKNVSFKTAKLGNDAGMVGAVLAAKNNI